MNRTIAVVGVVASTVVATALTAVPVSASESEAKSETLYVCAKGTPIWFNWSGKNPKTCQGVYKIERDGVEKLRIDNRKIKNWGDFVKALNAGWSSAQNWCSKNTLTCTVMTGVGVALISPLLSVSSKNASEA